MKSYKLAYTKTVAKEIQKLDGSVKKMLLAGLSRIEQDPEIGKPLTKELKGLRSYRVSSYRIVYKIENHQLLIIIVALGHRKNIYDRIKQALLANV